MIRGLGFWGLALLLAFLLPGRPQGHPLSPFPWLIALQTLALLCLMAAMALLLVYWRGPRLGRGRSLGVWEAIPDLLWGGLLLALWPAMWGPPGFLALAIAFLLAALPGELRWLARALPDEWPMPSVWGADAVLNCRRMALKNVLPHWLEARFPVWVTGTLVLERLLAVRGPASDWMMRIAYRERLGLMLWVVVLACSWAALRSLRR